MEQRDFARVDAGVLEQLLNGAGEISIANSRLTQQLSQIQFNLDELNQTVVRLREQLRKLEIETEAQILFRHQDEAEKPRSSTRWSWTVIPASSSCRAGWLKRPVTSAA